MSKIQLHRGIGFTDSKRAYKIEIDGSVAGKISAGESVSLDVTPGAHRIRLKIDWCSSNYLDFQAAPEETVVFDCGNSSPPGLTLLLYITIYRDKYLWIKRR